MLLRKLKGITPKYGKDCFFAENATLIGDVILGDQCSVWYNAVVRGDVHSIRMGNQVNIQDGAIIHATYKKAPTTIGNRVSIGHNAIVHGCTIQDDVLVGMGSIVMDDCIVERFSIIAAGAVVTQGTHVESGSIYAGIPARKIKTLDANLIQNEIERIAKGYVLYSEWYQEEKP
ncbi:MAG: gamma carbonic anhydrase family protein [Bacteroidetes bacterium]|nr:gamma carbonic anhydrase family protein [Bacteroidota bacterium]MDA0922658.1 gamma carbonic anhydrase family protein [Bacteroidota bacterium]MDA1288894.1 gamma carbonic anhydrase family protein [Bacteroidota bacterium]